MTFPMVENWTTIKRVLHYVKETLDFDILYGKHKELQFCGSTNLDWAGSMDEKKNTSSYVFSLGTREITMTIKKNNFISLSLIKVEYQEIMKVTCEAVWIRGMLVDMKIQQNNPTLLYYYNQ